MTINSTLGPNGYEVSIPAPVSGDSGLVVSYGASGSPNGAPVSIVDGAYVQASFGTPQRLKIPANTIIPGRSWIRFSITHRKTGAANAYLRMSCGPLGSHTEAGIVSSQISSAGTTPVSALLIGNVSIDSGYAYVNHVHFRGAVGTDASDRHQAIAIDWTVDNYLTIFIAASANGTVHQLNQFSIEVFTRPHETVASPVQNVLVKPEFFGLNIQDWPSSGSAPTLNFGSVSTYDNKRTHWGRMHTSANTVDWTPLDALVAACQARGVNDGTYVLYGTPTYLAQAGQAATTEPYGLAGGASYPTDLSALTWFCQQFAARNIETYGGFFKRVQLFNEPASGSFSGNAVSTSFWWGTAPQYVDMLATAYSALKTADPSLTMLTAGIDQVSALITWSSAQGPVTGKYGHQCFDAVAAHPYNAVPNPSYSGYPDVKNLVSTGVSAIRAALAPYAKSGVDIYATEYGFFSGSYTSVAANFVASETVANRKLRMQRALMSMIRNGIKACYIFSYQNVMNLSGDLSTDASGVIAGYNEVIANVVGKTVVGSKYYDDGRERLEFSDGTYYEI